MKIFPITPKSNFDRISNLIQIIESSYIVKNSSSKLIAEQSTPQTSYTLSKLYKNTRNYLKKLRG